ncbi:hypothetical protein [Prosthecobacter sp.]|uniref:hypothetical protein n=1 Tax=Prosthecobacter sp. TaxID=1965333 RepID=UPI003784B5A8
MISTAKINATVRQIGQFDAMVANFKENYHYLPGDAPAFGGDGDGVIDTTANCGWDDFGDANVCEIANFWHAMAPDIYAATACGAFGAPVFTSGPSRNVPASRLGRANSFFISLPLTLDQFHADKSRHQNYYVILSPLQVANDTWHHFITSISANAALTARDMLSLDSKIDDGYANSGSFVSGAIGNRGDGYGGIISSPLSTCSSGPNYDLTHDSEECTPLIRIGGTTGDPQ